MDRFCRDVTDREVEVKSAMDPTWQILRRW
jgi:hypothetical protein